MRLITFVILGLLSTLGFASTQTDWSQYDVVTCSSSQTTTRAFVATAINLLNAKDGYTGELKYMINQKNGQFDYVFHANSAEVEPKGKTTDLKYTGLFYAKGLPQLIEVDVIVTVDPYCIVRGLKATQKFTKLPY